MPPPLNFRKKGYFGPGSVEVSPPAGPGEGGVRRLAVERDALITQPAPGVDTLPDIISYSARTYGNRKAMGWRDVLDVHDETKQVTKVVNGKEQTEEKTWKYFELSDYIYIDYLQVKEAIEEAAKGLVELGVGKDDVIDMFAETGPNWQLICQACALISTTTATAYDTLGESGLTHSINEPKCVGIYTNPNLLPMLIKVLPQTPSIRFVFYDGSPSPAHLEQIRSLRPESENQIKAMHVDELRALGVSVPLTSLSERRPTRDTMACIMYTSGSTGAPKGVCLTHGNIVSAIGAMYTVFGPHIPAGDRYIAYLPLAHVLEYAVELCALFGGITIGYARPKTLTDASVRKCKGDLSTLRPNILFGVPAVYETIRKGILGKVHDAGLVKRGVFWLGLGLKKYLGPWVPGVGALVDALVLKEVREAVGGEIRFAVNGGATISRQTQEFFNLAVMPLTQGYGMTEACGMSAFLPPEMLTIGPVGIPAPCVEIKFLDCPEMGYFSSTSPSTTSGNGVASALTAAHLPQGEICIRGPSVTKGYFNRPDLNADEEIFTKDGWLRTGDIGQWNEDGSLSLIDRLKNLVKMQTGEYIALERLESVYKSSTLVLNLCVHAAPGMLQPVAIIVPHEDNLRRALRKGLMGGNGNGSSSTATANASAAGATSTSNVNAADVSAVPFPQLCASPAARFLVLKELTALAKKNKFARMEVLSGVILTPEEWTPMNGLVTSAQKVQRAKVRETWGAEIEKLKEQQQQ